MPPSDAYYALLTGPGLYLWLLANWYPLAKLLIFGFVAVHVAVQGVSLLLYFAQRLFKGCKVGGGTGAPYTFAEIRDKAYYVLRCLSLLRWSLYLSLLCCVFSGSSFMMAYAAETSHQALIPLPLLSYPSWSLGVLLPLELAVQPAVLLGARLQGSGWVSSLEWPSLTGRVSQAVEGVVYSVTNAITRADSLVNVLSSELLPVAYTDSPISWPSSGLVSLENARPMVLNPSSPWVQYYPTSSLAKGCVALTRMYASLPDGDLKTFIDDNCAFLHTPLVGDSPVSRSLINSAVVKGLPHSVIIGEHPSMAVVTARAGVYTVVLPGETEGFVSYAGKAYNVLSRYTTHYRALTHGCTKGTHTHPFYAELSEINGGSFKGCTFATVYEQDSFVSQFTAAYPKTPLSADDAAILGFYTDQILYSIEQAFSTEARPLHYKGGDITVKHSNWQPGYNPSTGAQPTSWIDTEGNRGYSLSVNQAAATLGRPAHYLKEVCNCYEPQWVKTKVGVVNVTVQGFPWVQVPSDRAPAKAPFITALDPASLPTGAYAYNEEWEQIMGPMNTRHSLCKALGVGASKGNFSLFNTQSLVWSGILGMNVYLVLSKRNAALPVRVTDDQGKVSVHSSAQQAFSALNPSESRTVGSLIKRYLILQQPYTVGEGTFTLQYCEAGVREAKLASMRASSVKADAKQYAKKKASKAAGTNGTDSEAR